MTAGPKNEIAEAIIRTLESPCQTVNLIEPANVVDGLYAIARAIDKLADNVEGLANATLVAHGK